MSAVWRLETENHTEKLVLLALADNANDSGHCWPSLASVSRKCQLTEQGVRNHIRSLEEKKWLVTTPRPGHSSTYQITLPPNTVDPPTVLTPQQNSTTPPNRNVPPPPNAVGPEPSIEPSRNHQVKRTSLKFIKPSLEEVQLVISKTGLPETDGIWFWNKCEGNGWTNGGKPIRSWPHTIAAWKAAGYMPSQKVNHANNQIPNTPKRYAQNPRNFGCIGDPARAAQKGADKIKREMDRMLAESAAKDELAKRMAEAGGQQPENPSDG